MRMKLIVELVIVMIAVYFLSSCTQNQAQQEVTVLIRMMPVQERFFREEIIPQFERENGCKIKVANFQKQWDIERLLKLETGKKNPQIALVKTPFEMTRVLALKDLMADLSMVVGTDQVEHDMAEYHPLASGLGYIDGKPYYLPRKLETRILFYRKSMVAEALEKFDSHRGRIDKELKTQNGYGLPSGYALESDPNEWDLYDLYVLGSIWANEEYNGVKVGRIAHRGAIYGGTATFLADRALQLGATKENLLTLSNDKVAEAFLWERVFVRNGLYNAGMWQDPWMGSNIYNGVKDGKVFMAWFQQIDNFLVHGWPDDPAMPSYLPKADDMGLALIPQGVSFDLDDQGKSLFDGSRSISTGGWWWGIPKTSPDKELAYKLARFITSKEIQGDECSRFGMLPVRKDILNNLANVFTEGWVGDIFQKSIQQIKENELTTVPLVVDYTDVGKSMVQAWYKLCVEYDEEKNGEMDLSTMKMRLESDFGEKLKEILGKQYPEE